MGWFETPNPSSACACNDDDDDDADDGTEEEDEQLVCTELFHVMCDNHERCYHHLLKCDGFYDCSDHSDESPDDLLACGKLGDCT